MKHTGDIPVRRSCSFEPRLWRFATYSCCSLWVTFGGTSTNDKIAILLKCQTHFMVHLKMRENKPVITPVPSLCCSFFHSLVCLLCLHLPPDPPPPGVPHLPPAYRFCRLLVYLLKPRGEARLCKQSPPPPGLMTHPNPQNKHSPRVFWVARAHRCPGLIRHGHVVPRGFPGTPPFGGGLPGFSAGRNVYVHTHGDGAENICNTEIRFHRFHLFYISVTTPTVACCSAIKAIPLNIYLLIFIIKSWRNGTSQNEIMK